MPPSPSLHRRSWCPAPPPRSARRTYPKVCNALDSLTSLDGQRPATNVGHRFLARSNAPIWRYIPTLKTIEFDKRFLQRVEEYLVMGPIDRQAGCSFLILHDRPPL